MSKTVFGMLVVVLTCGAVCLGAIYDINKDVHNNSGEDAYGFVIELDGEPNILDNYNGFPNRHRFRTFAPPGRDNGTTILKWTNPLLPDGSEGPVPHCTWVHVGYKMDAPANILRSYWTNADGDLLIDVNQVSQFPETSPDGSVTLTVANTLVTGNPVTFTIEGFSILDEPIPLAELNSDNGVFDNANLTPPPGGATEVVLGPGESWSMTVPDVPDDKVFVYVKKSKDFNDYGQLDPAPVLPTMSQWGLIVMVALLAGAGVIMIARRQHRTAA